MREEPRVEIDMTPMIDIVFQLLTFFMVVINFEAADADERVKMAVSDLARPPKVKPAETLVVQVGFNREQGRSRPPVGVFTRAARSRWTASNPTCSNGKRRSIA